MSTTKSVYIVYTGGTIGMQESNNGYIPVAGFLENYLKTEREFQTSEMPEYTINEYQPLLDSSNMIPDDWVKIAQDIKDNYDNYDGFVILHGTDTMVYTASALSFMLENLGKSVIMTGSQIPISKIRNDARDNLIASLLIASNYNIPEVCICFNNKLLRGNRTQKVDAGALSAFNSGSYPPLGIVGINISISWDLVLQKPKNKFRIQKILNPAVGAVRLFPGISEKIIRNFLRDPIKGLVIESYGTGNAPDRNPDLISAIKDATDRGIVVVACTQSHIGMVDLDKYATGQALKNAGVISGFDLTTEAALTKLFYLFGRGLSSEEVKLKMQENLRGEMTFPH